MKAISNEKETDSIYKNEESEPIYKRGYSINSRIHIPMSGLIEEDEGS
jgi:hypothetical protein